MRSSKHDAKETPRSKTDRRADSPNAKLTEQEVSDVDGSSMEHIFRDWR